VSEDRKKWTIKPLCFGEFPHMEKSGFTYYRNQGVKISSPAIGFLLLSGERAVLVDTGPGDPDTEHHSSHTAFTRTAEQVPSAAVTAAGVRPEDLETVVLTHLHYDHSYNLGLFPNASFVVQAEELRAAVDPIAAQRSTYEFGLSGLIPPWMRLTDRLTIVRGDTELLPGIRLLHLPGHTPGMQAVLVETTEGPHLIASDLISLYDNLGSGPHDAVMPGIHTDLAACERSIERVFSLGATVLPSHDWRVLRHQSYPVRPE
jgi:N-acyl homoserine lactone hydrolase